MRENEGREGWGSMPFERMIAVLRYRGLDGEAMRLAQERQMETMREAAEMLSRTMQDIGTRQATLLRETMERMVGSIPGAGGDNSVADLTRRQMEVSREQVEASVAAFRAIADLMWDCGRSAFDLMNRTMTESVEAMTKPNGHGAAEEGGAVTPAALPKPAPKARTRR